MTQSLRRERRQKFAKILHTWIKDTPAITGVISSSLILDEEITALAVMLADAATSATERRIEEEFGDQNPNIFKIYEQNIGALSPMLADELKEIEKDYPSGWFEDAVKEALGKNVRNLKYIKAILARWKVEGRGDNRKKEEQPEPKKRKIYDPSQEPKKEYIPAPENLRRRHDPE